MNLTAYSDSESDGDAPAPAPAAVRKAAFQRVVDRANPGKIKVSLPSAAQLEPPTGPRDAAESAPPAKRARLGGGSGGGAFGGFNAMLPAPKKPNTAAIAAAADAAPGKRPLGRRLGAGISLKTGAEPAFQRQPRPASAEYDETGNPIKKEPLHSEDFRAMLNLPPARTEPAAKTTVQAEELGAVSTTARPAAPRFVPLSVGRGSQKKRPVVVHASAVAKAVTTPPVEKAPVDAQPVRKPKVSLFGVAQAAQPAGPAVAPDQYQPLLHAAGERDGGRYGEGDGDGDGGGDRYQVPRHHEPLQSLQHAVQPLHAPPQSGLTSIASELKLSEAEQRQLFGKRGRGPDLSAARIVDFNTDAEYAHNERLRQQGESVQHNPLKSISGTGKNSLRSLVATATSQKDALEDHFATGHRNKKEAGNRYGW